MSKDYSMISIVPKNGIDDLDLYKFLAKDKICRVIESIQEEGAKKMVKTASVDQNTMLNFFTQMLTSFNLMIGNGKPAEVLNSVSANNEPDLSKSAGKKTTGKDKKEEIRIVSKSIKDSHYQIDISKDTIVKGGKKMYMVSCYARDAYLGRYLIKRNFFYTADGKYGETFADAVYDEVLTKISAIRDRYYDEVIDVSEIFAQIKKSLDGVISEIKMEEDSVGTNVSR